MHSSHNFHNSQKLDKVNFLAYLSLPPTPSVTVFFFCRKCNFHIHKKFFCVKILWTYWQDSSSLLLFNQGKRKNLPPKKVHLAA